MTHLTVSPAIGAYELSIVADVANPTPYHNASLPEDVNGDGQIVPIDALIVINALNNGLGGALPIPPIDDPPPFLDVNGSNSLEAFDVLMIINHINNNKNSVFATPEPPASVDISADSAVERTEMLQIRAKQIRGLAIDQFLDELDREKSIRI